MSSIIECNILSKKENYMPSLHNLEHTNSGSVCRLVNNGVFTRFDIRLRSIDIYFNTSKFADLTISSGGFDTLFKLLISIMIRKYHPEAFDRLEKRISLHNSSSFGHVTVSISFRTYECSPKLANALVPSNHILLNHYRHVHKIINAMSTKVKEKGCSFANKIVFAKLIAECSSIEYEIVAEVFDEFSSDGINDLRKYLASFNKKCHSNEIPF